MKWQKKFLGLSAALACALVPSLTAKQQASAEKIALQEVKQEKVGHPADSSFAIVNFASCASDSKLGKSERENFEVLRKQVTSMIENTEKEIKEITTKFEDTEYLDSLSPKAEEELKAKYQSLNQDLSRYQNQFYQVLQHAQMQLMQKINTNVAKVAKKIAEENN